MAAPMRPEAEGEATAAGNEAAASAGSKRALEGLELLLGRSRDAGHLQAMKHADLLASLSFSLAALEERFAQDPQWAELQRMRTEISRQAWGLTPSPEVPWTFVCQALLLLLCLKQCLVRLAAIHCLPQPSAKTTEAATPLSPDTLSIAQEKTVQAALQLVVALGLCPYLLPGVGLSLRHRTEFSALVQDAVSPTCFPVAMRKLWATSTALVGIAQHPSLGRLALTRHLGDLLAGLCQLGFCPARKKGAEASPQEEQRGLTEEERRGCREALQSLLDRVYQPLVVRELLLLQGGPKQAVHPSRHRHERCLVPAPAWLQRLCGHLLSGRLIRPGGVQAVIRGILEGAGEGAAGGSDAEAAAADWQKCDAVARILSSCPQQSLSLEDYYQQVCPQVLQLFLIQNKLTACQFQRVATSTVLTMVRQHPQQAEKHLLHPLLEPLLRCLEGAGSLEDLPAGPVLVKEEELTGCVETVFKVCVVGDEPSACLLGSLQRVLGAIFALWAFTKRNVSSLRSPCREILLWFLAKSEREASLAALEGLAGLRGTVRLLHPHCQFRVGSEGGVVAAVQEADSDEDEDEALYQKVSSEQWQLEQLAGLLSHCQRSGLAGDFFLRCLKELAPMTPEKDPHLPTDQSPPDPEQPCSPALQEQTRQLRVLQVVAMLAEGISDSLLTGVTQIVDFVATTLQRACASLSRGLVGTVEAQTLSMAMGLVAAMLGGAVQLESADWATLKQLVPLLDEISRVHPDPVIQELATDLGISVCTHAAFSTEAVSAAAHRAQGKTRGGPAGKAEVASRAPDESPRPGSLLEQKPPCHALEESPGVESAAAAPSSPSPHSAQDLQELLGGAYDPEVPTRAAALRLLSRLVEQRDPAALNMQERLLKVFMENLEHKDSFVYLSAIQGVALLSDAFPQQVLPSLLAEYGSAPKAETRMKVGEALLRATRALGDLVSPHRDQLIHAFLRGVRDPDGSLRASSLSNLGELCQILGFQLGSLVHELASCLAAVVKTDREAEVRRAAVHVVVLLLRGLSTKALEVLRDVLLDLYRLLKFVLLCEQDEVTVLHAQLALEELDGTLRGFLFPRQTLQKKIEILP